MGVTTTKLRQPARFHEFGLGVDDVFDPSRMLAYRQSPRGTMEEVASIGLLSGDELLEWLVNVVGFPAATSRALDVQLAQKLHAAALRPA